MPVLLLWFPYQRWGVMRFTSLKVTKVSRFSQLGHGKERGISKFSSGGCFNISNGAGNPTNVLSMEMLTGNALGERKMHPPAIGIVFSMLLIFVVFFVESTMTMQSLETHIKAIQELYAGDQCVGATMVGQRIWQRHYYLVAKRMLTKVSTTTYLC